MREDEFDVLSATHADGGQLLALKRIDPSKPIDLDKKEKYMAMPFSKWVLYANRRELTLDVLNIQGKIRQIPDEV